LRVSLLRLIVFKLRDESIIDTLKLVHQSRLFKFIIDLIIDLIDLLFALVLALVFLLLSLFNVVILVLIIIRRVGGVLGTRQSTMTCLFLQFSRLSGGLLFLYELYLSVISGSFLLVDLLDVHIIEFFLNVGLFGCEFILVGLAATG